MLLADMLVNAINAALEDRKIVLDHVGMHIAPYILAPAVIDSPMTAQEHPMHPVIDAGLVGMNARVTLHLIGQDAHQSMRIGLLDLKTADFPAALDQRIDRDQMLAAKASIAARNLPPNSAVSCRIGAYVGFVDLDNCSRAAHLAAAALVAFGHGLSDPMAQEPSAFQRDPEGAVQLV